MGESAIKCSKLKVSRIDKWIKNSNIPFLVLEYYQIFEDKVLSWIFTVLIELKGNILIKICEPWISKSYWIF